ncbi:hypothetical protein ACLOJK_004479 [Asimina triloba]
MNVLVCSGSEALCTHGSATWMKRRRTQHPKAIHSQPQSYWQWQRQWGRKMVMRQPPPQAAGKGFGGSGGMSAAAEQYRRREGGGRETQEEENEENNIEEDEDVIPEVVFERMFARIVFFVTTPMALGFGLLYVLGVLKEQQLWEAPVWLQLLTILLAFGTSSLGLAYGTLSTNWDPDETGSLLGWEEAQKNWPELWKESPANRKR